MWILRVRDNAAWHGKDMRQDPGFWILMKLGVHDLCNFAETQLVGDSCRSDGGEWTVDKGRHSDEVASCLI